MTRRSRTRQPTASRAQPIRRLALALAGALVAAAPALALSPVNKSLFGGVAIGGTDPVAYFTEGRAVAGSSRFGFEWRGATWRFASAGHRDLFARDPERYAPQYGGYCAWAVSRGYTADIDPEAWRIVEGRLYLNYDREVQARWAEDVPGNIRKADENWPKLLAGE